jgi:hypothetical protein
VWQRARKGVCETDRPARSSRRLESAHPRPAAAASPSSPARQAAKELAALDTDAAVARLCELNVLRQVGGGSLTMGTSCSEQRGAGASVAARRREAGQRPVKPHSIAPAVLNPAAARPSPHAPRPPKVFHVCTSGIVQSAWAEGTQINVVGMIYDVADGTIHKLTGPLTSASDVNALRFDGGGAAAGKKRPAPAAAAAPKGKAAEKEPAAKKAKAAAPAKKAPAARKAPAKPRARK